MSAMSAAVDAYITQHNLDERACAQLRALGPAEQMQVMGADVSAARNVSAVVSSLCRNTKPDPVENYIMQHSLDERSAEQLRALDPEDQMQVMETDVSRSRNVSAVVSSLIRKAQKGEQDRGTKRPRMLIS